MASEQLKAVLELVGSVDLGTLTLQERRALMGSAGAPPPEGTQVDPVDANGVPAEWVAAAGVTGERVVLYSTKEWKKTRLVYFSPDAEEWERRYAPELQRA